MIRQATAEDIPQLVEMGRAFHDHSGMPFAFNEVACERFITGLVAGGGVFIGPNGMIGGTLAPAYADPGWLMAVEFSWWAKGNGLGLLAAFEKWAADMGAQEVRMTSLARLERAGRILELKGYEPVEISYRKVL